MLTFYVYTSCIYYLYKIKITQVLMNDELTVKQFSQSGWCK